MKFTKIQLYMLINLHPTDRSLWLPRADLSGADLARATLNKADLSEAKLRWADVSNADLRGADLGGTDLSHADLRGAVDWEQATQSGLKLFPTIMPDGTTRG